MAACDIQYLLLLFLLSFTPYSGALTCHEGIMIKYGRVYAEQPLEWNTTKTKIAGPQQICQETLLIVDVGENSVLLASKGLSNPGNYRNELILKYATGPGMAAASYYKLCGTDLCNHATSSQILLWTLPPSANYSLGTRRCPVCLDFQGSCTRDADIAACPKNTHCYAGNIEINGGGINTIISIGGCLDVSAKTLLKGNKSIGIFSVVEKVTSSTENLFSHLFVPGTSLAWVLGLAFFFSCVLRAFPSLLNPFPCNP